MASLIWIVALVLVAWLVCFIVGNPLTGRKADRATLDRLTRRNKP